MDDKPKETQATEPPLVLVVDDDKDASRLVATYLKRAGFGVALTESGEEACLEARSKSPDVILLDLHLPGQDGFATCKELRKEESTRDIPVIILSAHRSREDVLRALESGADDFLVKPIDPHLLLHKIHTNLPREDPFISSGKRDGVPPTTDQRQFVRLREEAEAVLHLPLEVVDISEGGVGLLSESPVHPGNTLVLSCDRFEEIFGLREVTVKVKYAVEFGGRKKYRLGVEFVGLSEPERKKIRQYIFRRQVSKVKLV